MDTSVVASPADLLATVPIAQIVKSGNLMLAEGRLSFVSPGGAVLLDAPVEELHSVAKAAIGMHVWHEKKRFRFAFGKENPTRAESWVNTLKPVVGSPPSGVTVRRPWPAWAWLAAMIGTVGCMMTVAIVIETVTK